ncbi:MAG: MMPL family transporter [Desulfobacter sp.]|nr:MMPL family transporter [Desulfobacter sp.]
MQKLMRFSHAHPFITMLILLGISAWAAMQLPTLVIDPSMEGLRAGDQAGKDSYQAAVDTFGSDKINIIYLKDKDLFTPEKLTLVEELVVELEDMPGILKVESLFSTNNFKNEEGMLVTGPLAGWVPETQEESQALLDDALANPMIAGDLVGDTKNSMTINLFVDPKNQSPDFSKEITLGIDKLLLVLEPEFETVFQIGDPTLRYEIANMMLMDQKHIVPLSVLILLLTLALVTRSAACAALPLLTSFTSILWVLGFMGLMNILTVIVPSLILVIGSTEDVHLLLEYDHGLHTLGEKSLAINMMMQKMGLVVMITALPTFLGFLSICLNDVIMLRQFGYAASFGLFVNPLITCMITPVYLSIFGRSQAPAPHSQKQNPWVSELVDAISRHKKVILAGMILVTIVIGLFGFRLKLENDYISMFRKGTPILSRLDQLTSEFPGTQTFFIHIQGGHPDLFKDPENLDQVADIQTLIRTNGQFDKTSSLVDFLTLINREMNGGKPEKEVLPESKERISQYLAFLEDDDISRYVNPDFSQVNIMVRHNLNSSHELKIALNGLETQIRNILILNPHFYFTITGDSILTLKGADAIADGQAKSIFLLLFIIFIIMSILFTNIKAGLLSLVPNIIPVVINFGIMGLFSIPLNVGTAMVAVIAIGIAVDDTLHFMTRYNDEMHQVKNQDQAIRICLTSEFRVVAATSVSLSLGFAVLGFSQFIPIVQFGILSAVVILVAFLCDILVTPVLLSTTRLLTMWDILSLKLKKEVIEQSEFFRDLKLWQIKKIVLLARMSQQKEGENIYIENEQASETNPRSMYLLLEGNVSRYHIQSDTGKEVPVGFYAPGDIFGYISPLNNTPRSANTKALTDIKYVEINQESLDRLRTMYPHIWGKVYRNLARILGDQLVVWQGVFSERRGL